MDIQTKRSNFLIVFCFRFLVLCQRLSHKYGDKGEKEKSALFISGLPSASFQWQSLCFCVVCVGRANLLMPQQRNWHLAH